MHAHPLRVEGYGGGSQVSTANRSSKLLPELYSSVQKQILDILEGWLRHKSDMVNFEAARAICDMKGVTPAQLTRSIAGMH